MNPDDQTDGPRHLSFSSASDSRDTYFPAQLSSLPSRPSHRNESYHRGRSQHIGARPTITTTTDIDSALQLQSKVLENTNILNDILQRQKELETKIESTVIRGSSNGNGRDDANGHSLQAIHSLAGRLQDDGWSEREYYQPTDNAYDDTPRRAPTYRLDRPFPRPRYSRWTSGNSKRDQDQTHDTQEGHVVGPSSDGHPQGQVGGGPGGHHGSPVRGYPLGETAGGPAALETYQEEPELSGSQEEVEHTDSNDSKLGDPKSYESEQTLVIDEKQDHEGQDECPNAWFAARRRMREPLAEWLATMVAVLIGVSANLQFKTSGGDAGGYTQAASMWGLGAMMSIYIAGGISGAHCTQSNDLDMLSLFRGFPAHKCVIYIIAQTVGAICAVWIAYGLYADAIMDSDPEKSSTFKGTGTAFFTLPRPFATPTTAFFTDFTSAAVLAGTILAMGDDRNSPPGAGMHAFIIGLVVFALAATLGYNTGPQTNPAKDLASRIVPCLVGYGADMWQHSWWVEAWCAAISGGIFGCLVYDVAIFEGPESPVNYPQTKRERARREIKFQWLKTNLFGTARKERAKRDLETGGLEEGKEGEGTGENNHSKRDRGTA